MWHHNFNTFLNKNDFERNSISTKYKNKKLFDCCSKTFHEIVNQKFKKKTNIPFL